MAALIFALVGAFIGWGASGYDHTWAAIGAVLGFLAGGLLACGRTAGDRS